MIERSDETRLAELEGDVKSLASSVEGVAKAVRELAGDVKAIGRQQAASDARSNSIPYGVLAGGGGLLLGVMALYVNPLDGRLGRIEEDYAQSKRTTAEEILPGVSRRISALEVVNASAAAQIAENAHELDLQWVESHNAMEWRGAMSRFREETDRRLKRVENTHDGHSLPVN